MRLRAIHRWNFFFWGYQPRMDGTTGKTCFSQWFEAPFVLSSIHFATAEH